MEIISKKVIIIPTTTITFTDMACDLSAGTKYRYQIIGVAEDIEKYISAGKDPVDALDFLLGFYQSVPHVQVEIRSVLMKVLDKYNGK